MQQQYVPPELKMAGRTDEVVLGGGGVGFDLFSEELSTTMEFETDGAAPAGEIR